MTQLFHPELMMEVEKQREVCHLISSVESCTCAALIRQLAMIQN